MDYILPNGKIIEKDGTLYYGVNKTQIAQYSQIPSNIIYTGIKTGSYTTSFTDDASNTQHNETIDISLSSKLETYTLMYFVKITSGTITISDFGTSSTSVEVYGYVRFSNQQNNEDLTVGSIPTMTSSTSSVTQPITLYADTDYVNPVFVLMPNNTWWSYGISWHATEYKKLPVVLNLISSSKLKLSWKISLNYTVYSLNYTLS